MHSGIVSRDLHVFDFSIYNHLTLLTIKKYIYSKVADHRPNNKGRSKLLMDLVEMILVSICFPFSIWFVKKFLLQGMEVKKGEGLLFYAFILISWFVLSTMTSQAKIPRTQRFITLTFQFARITLIVFLGLIAVKMLFRLTSLPYRLIAVYITTMFMVTVLFRLLAFKAFKTYPFYGKNAHHVLIMADAFSDGIIENLLIQKEWGFKIQYIFTDSKLINAKYGSRIPVIPTSLSIGNLIDHGIIDEVIWCRRDMNVELIKNVLDLCNEVGVIFRFQSSVSPLDHAEFQLKAFNNRRDMSLVDAPSNSLSLVIKTMADIYLSLMAIILLSPLIIVIATVIKIGSKGPVFFKQERIGLRGRKFRLYKFRTMVFDAEKQFINMKAMNEADGPVFKIKYDPRITRVGRFLRKTGLDELLQFYNVIRGEMSLIGPRPPLEEEVRQYERWQLRKLSVKPGITCSWQIVPNRHDVSFESWMKMDLQYIDNWNLSRDLGLFLKTVRTFFIAGGH
jgi:exopolysaccharide biosynthesis polyprenyl glycosylphosphotransferase